MLPRVVIREIGQRKETGDRTEGNSCRRQRYYTFLMRVTCGRVEYVEGALLGMDQQTESLHHEIADLL